MAALQCTPCRNGDKGLEEEEISTLLLRLHAWERVADGAAIRRRFSFKNFAEALAFVNRVGDVADEQDHHPDISFGWGYAEVVFTTHSIGGLHRNDFIMAELVDGLLHDKK